MSNCASGGRSGSSGAVCGAAAAIAISAVDAGKQDAAVVVSIVILWAIIMIFVLPFVPGVLGLSVGGGCAWIRTSDVADAAGFAAAQTFGGIAAKLPGAAPGAVDQRSLPSR